MQILEEVEDRDSDGDEKKEEVKLQKKEIKKSENNGVVELTILVDFENSLLKIEGDGTTFEVKCETLFQLPDLAVYV